MPLDPDSLQRIATVCIGNRARMAARALTRHYNAHFRPLGLTAGQFGILLALSVSPGQTVVMLADTNGIDATTMVRGIQQLERRGLVESVGGRGRQSKKSSLTKSGASLLRRAIPCWEAAYASIAGHMGPRALERSLAALRSLERAATLAQQ